MRSITGEKIVLGRREHCPRRCVTNGYSSGSSRDQAVDRRLQEVGSARGIAAWAGRVARWPRVLPADAKDVVQQRGHRCPLFFVRHAKSTNLLTNAVETCAMPDRRTRPGATVSAEPSGDARRSHRACPAIEGTNGCSGVAPVHCRHGVGRRWRRRQQSTRSPLAGGRTPRMATGTGGEPFGQGANVRPPSSACPGARTTLHRCDPVKRFLTSWAAARF